MRTVCSLTVFALRWKKLKVGCLKQMEDACNTTTFPVRGGGKNKGKKIKAQKDERYSFRC